MKKNTVLILLWLLHFNAFCQAAAENLTAIRAGDKIPDITIENLINYPSKTAHISDFSSKLLILDFWATWCSSCIQNFPKLYDLQQRFPGQLQVLLVNSKSTRDTKAGIQSFLDKRKELYHFPCAVLDTVLKKLFPHRAIPHTVLIKNNTVIAITDAESVNESNIKEILNGKTVALFAKNDRSYDARKPLFEAGNGGEPAPYLYRSTLFGRISNLPNSIGFSMDKDSFNGIHVFNASLPLLYLFAYPEYSGFKLNKVILQPRSGNHLLDTITRSGIENSVFTYESIFPPHSRNGALAIIRTDLYRYFHLTIDSQYRDTLCYVLRLNKNVLPKDVPHDVKAETNINEKGHGLIYFTNYPVSDLLDVLEDIYRVPFVDETRYTKNVNLRMPDDLRNENELKKSLSRQGFILSRERRKTSYLVLSEEQNAE